MKVVGIKMLRAVVGVRVARAIQLGSTMGPLGTRFEKSSVAEALLLSDVRRGGLALGLK
ncbi:MAG: hypothetical protein JO324_02390 [Candidatus Eremiobacteraeota bacterium]|nr:hypothetical protein [Candidatus Eremiobacteraeota bacterium]